MRHIKPLAIFMLGLATSSCTKTGTATLVEVTASTQLSIVRLHATATIGMQTKEFDIPLSQASVPPAVSFTIEVPPPITGALAVKVDAYDSEPKLIASGTGSGALVPGQRQNISITLSALATQSGDMAVGADMTGIAGAMDLSIPQGGQDLAMDLSIPQGGQDLGPPDMYQASWHIESSGTSVALYGVTGLSGSDVYAVGASGSILHRDATGAWAAQSSNFPTSTLLKVWESPGGFIYVVGIDNSSNGLILFSKGLGSWTQQSVTDGSGTITVTALDGVSGCADNDVTAVGPGGVMIHTSGGSGVLWRVLPIPGTPTNGLSGVGGGAVGKTYACGEGGLCVSHVDGANVTVIPNTTTSTQTNLNGVSVTSAGELYAVGLSGTLIYASAAGIFSPVNTHTTSDLYGVAATANAQYAVGVGGVIIRSAGGAPWASDTVNAAPGVTLPTADLQAVWEAPNGEVFAVGKSGTILHRY